MELTCPKCRGAMRTYERSGITVDQCGECRGIFLDRGELERLVDAETSFHGGAQPAYGSPVRDRDGDGDGDGDRDRGREPYRDKSDYRYGEDKHRYRDGRDDDYYKKRKKRSFLEELFD